MNLKRKTPEKLLAAFKKANTERREAIAANAGFPDTESYLKHLETQIQNTKPVAKPVIHNVVILDASGSMHGSKFDNAVRAIDSEVETLKTVTDVDYLYTREIFSGRSRNTYSSLLNQPLNNVGLISHYASGGTPLFNTINIVLNKLFILVKEGEKVLVNIFTDGEDTSGGFNYAKEAVDKAVKLGWTITFVGTQSDVKSMIEMFNLDESNTLIHDNTAESVTRSLSNTTMAKLSYSKAVVDGASTQELQSNFYKRTGKL